MDSSLNIQPATPEIVWAMLRENAERQRELTERQAETDKNLDSVWKQIKETGKNLDSVWKQIDKTNQQLGGMAYNQGRFAEEYFFNSFEKGQQNFFGEKFDEIKNNLKGIETDDEYDIVMLNGQSVGIVEVKYKAHENDVPKVLGKVNSFRANFPKYKYHTIYIGLATMAFYPELEQTCKENGIAIIKQSGETIVIYDEHLKAF
jgi:hypothetical protein